ncbi:MAG: hypothetical protein PHU85_05775 [Phycisphaerae bacterium]|nr:hypothetical protein [Phycisphaerae bacterium]
MGMSFISLAMAFLIGGSSGADLLRFISSQNYWAAQKVEITVDNMATALGKPGEAKEIADLASKLGDREHKVRVEAHAKLVAMGPAIIAQLNKAMESPANEEARLQLKEVLAELSGKGQAAAVRRLMAIRALGELKDAKAVPTLKPLLESKALFEAEYAARAIAAVEGKEYRPAVDPAKAVREDVWLLPKNCGVVAQATLPDLGIKGLDDLLAPLKGDKPGPITKEMVDGMASQM